MTADQAFADLSTRRQSIASIGLSSITSGVALHAPGHKNYEDSSGSISRSFVAVSTDFLSSDLMSKLLSLRCSILDTLVALNATSKVFGPRREK